MTCRSAQHSGWHMKASSGDYDTTTTSLGGHLPAANRRGTPSMPHPFPAGFQMNLPSTSCTSPTQPEKS